MTKGERWISSVALIISVIPIVLISVMQVILPNELIAIGGFANEEILLDEDKYFFLGLFSVFPVIVLIVGRLVRYHHRMFLHFNGVILGSFILSAMNIIVVIYIMVSALAIVGTNNMPDFVSLTASLLAFAACLAVNAYLDKNKYPLFIFKRPKPHISSKTKKKIMRRNEVCMIYGMLFAGVAAGFFRGYSSIIFVVVCILVITIFMALNTNISYKKFDEKDAVLYPAKDHSAVSMDFLADSAVTEVESVPTASDENNFSKDNKN